MVQRIIFKNKQQRQKIATSYFWTCSHYALFFKRILLFIVLTIAVKPKKELPSLFCIITFFFFDTVLGPMSGLSVCTQPKKGTIDFPSSVHEKYIVFVSSSSYGSHNLKF